MDNGRTRSWSNRKARDRPARARRPERGGGGYVVRMPKAYPYYDADYKHNVRRCANGWRSMCQRSSRRSQRDAPLQQPGPLDVHRHAHGREHPGASHDVWSVNVEEEYHEEMKSGPSRGASGLVGAGGADPAEA